MAHQMSGGKTPGSKAYDKGYSAFQKKGLISPLHQTTLKAALVEDAQTDYVKTEFPVGGGTLHKTEGDGKTAYRYEQGGQSSSKSSGEAEELIKQSVLEQDIKKAGPGKSSGQITKEEKIKEEEKAAEKLKGGKVIPSGHAVTG